METTHVKKIPDFTLFEGPNNREMPKLIAEGFVPASAAQIMRGRLEGKLSFDEYHDSGDVIVYHPDGRVKLVYDSKDLRKLNTESPLSAGALVLPDGAWESLGGEEFSHDRLALYVGKRRSKDSTKGNPFWQWLARDDQALLDAYADQMFDRVKQRYGYDEEAMGIFISSSNNVPVLRLWCLGGVANYYGGNADGDCRLDYDGGRLAGVGAPEAPRGEKARVSAPRKKVGRIGEPSYPKRPSLEEVLGVAMPYIADVNQDDFKLVLSKLYHK